MKTDQEINQHREQVAKALARLLRAHPDFGKRALKISEYLASRSVPQHIKQEYREACNA